MNDYVRVLHNIDDDEKYLDMLNCACYGQADDVTEHELCLRYLEIDKAIEALERERATLVKILRQSGVDCIFYSKEI